MHKGANLLLYYSTDILLILNSDNVHELAV
jgi:hypothetical protein